MEVSVDCEVDLDGSSVKEIWARTGLMGLSRGGDITRLYCPKCKMDVESVGGFCAYCGTGLLTAAAYEQQTPRPVEHRTERRGKAAVKAVVVVVALVILFIFGLPFIANFLQSTSQQPVPVVSQVTYTAHITTMAFEFVRYNVVSWNVVDGVMPGTSTVTLYYAGGGSETFYWVIYYRFEKA